MREIQRDAIKTEAQSFPSDKYRVLYADPPWKYGDQLTENYGAAKYHYSSMSISELCELPVADIAEENSVLFLWVTSPLLEECFQVIGAWGFKYKASFVWDKVKHNMGHYNSVRHEFLLICTRGSCLPDVNKLIDSVQSIERSDKHSEKPKEFREIIKTLYPAGKKVELFAREKREGWVVWGNQI
jgi:N6-adenosine-specific RNA methylase IME4